MQNLLELVKYDSKGNLVYNYDIYSKSEFLWKYNGLIRLKYMKDYLG